MTSDHGRRPSSGEAQQALDSISESKKALAPYVRSPKWLYPVQGLGMGLMIIGMVLSKDYGWAPGVVAVAVTIFCLLPLLQSSRGRVVVEVYTHRASRGLGIVHIASFTFILIVAFVLYALFAFEWMVFSAAVLALILTLVMGPAMETRLQHAVRNGLR